MSGCDANTVLTTVIGFSLLVVSEILPFFTTVQPNGILDALSKVIKTVGHNRELPVAHAPLAQPAPQQGIGTVSEADNMV